MEKKIQNWFTADLHFGHRNILAYDGRPFSSIEEHDEAIIANIQNVVKPWDNLYILGDFGFGDYDFLEAKMMQLPGNKYFVKGNHDRTKIHGRLYQKYGTYWGEKKTISLKIDGTKHRVVFDHFPGRSWDRSHHNDAFHLYGHHHGGLDPEYSDWGKSMDVGITNNTVHPYHPFEWGYIYETLKDKPIKDVQQLDKKHRIG